MNREDQPITTDAISATNLSEEKDFRLVNKKLQKGFTLIGFRESFDTYKGRGEQIYILGMLPEHKKSRPIHYTKTVREIIEAEKANQLIKKGWQLFGTRRNYYGFDVYVLFHSETKKVEEESTL